MRKLLFLLVIVCFSCNSDDEDNSGSLSGKWELVSTTLFGEVTPWSKNCNNSFKEIEFAGNGVYKNLAYYKNSDNVCIRSQGIGEWNVTDNKLITTINTVNGAPSISPGFQSHSFIEKITLLQLNIKPDRDSTFPEAPDPIVHRETIFNYRRISN